MPLGSGICKSCTFQSTGSACNCQKQRSAPSCPPWLQFWEHKSHFYLCWPRVTSGAEVMSWAGDAAYAHESAAQGGSCWQVLAWTAAQQWPQVNTHLEASHRQQTPEQIAQVPPCPSKHVLIHICAAPPNTRQRRGTIPKKCVIVITSIAPIPKNPHCLFAIHGLELPRERN